jgi:hypothetical protein
MQSIYSLLLVILWSFFQAIAFAEDAPQKLPVLAGKITFTEGSFNGFGPPQVGDSLRLDLRGLEAIKDKLPFSGLKSSYVALTAPLRIEKLHRSGNGAFQSARLVSFADKGRWRVTIDIQHYGAFSPPRARMLIIGESSVINSVARLECELSQ